ncbi:MAG: single-stranded-DNA-specific exonuclease RecJ [Pirellulales bacterium]
MSKIWRYSPHDESQIRQLSSHLRISPLTAKVLIARGYATQQQAADFLNARLADLHDPELLPGVADAADRVVAAVKAKRRITIYGDYDVDGVTATSLLWHCLKLQGATVDYYIPSRLEEGYGLNEQALRQLAAEDATRLVITVDCGISGVAEAAVARSVGLEMIITDHHQMLDKLPAAACLVHPRLPGSQYPFRDLCGVGVAFKLAWGICQRLGDGKKASPQMREFLKGAVGLTAIGTVADVVPLLGENRVLVRYGLKSLVERSTPGMQALMKIAGLDTNRQLQAEDIGFAIAPRLNAAGRLGQARLAVELLTTENKERADALADYLDELNNNRRTVERRIFKQAKELVAANPAWSEQRALVLTHRDWHAGVIGIVASRVAEHFQKPAILISLQPDDLGLGSGRSYGGADLHAALSSCAEHLQSFGGHQAAAGLKIRADRVDAFREAICAYCTENHESCNDGDELRIDAEVRLADVTRQSVGELDRLGPFGQENPRPIFAASRIELAEPPRTMGDGDHHLSLKVRQYGSVFRAIAFGKGEWAEQIARAEGPISISFAPAINRFRGRESVELELKDWRVDARSGIKAPTGADTIGQ